MNYSVNVPGMRTEPLGARSPLARCFARGRVRRQETGDGKNYSVDPKSKTVLPVTRKVASLGFGASTC